MNALSLEHAPISRNFPHNIPRSEVLSPKARGDNFVENEKKARVRKKSKRQKTQDVLAKDKQAKSKGQPDLRVDTT